MDLNCSGPLFVLDMHDSFLCCLQKNYYVGIDKKRCLFNKGVSMFWFFYEKVVTYFAQHVILNAFAHTAAGFGLAIVLQHYLKGNAFLPVYVGWLLIAVCAVAVIMVVK